MIPLIGGLLILLWAWWSKTPWSAIGYVRPTNWISAIGLGIVFGIAFKLLMKAVIMPLLGADPINTRYHFLVGNTAALPGMIFIILFGAGFGEETIWRGFLFDRLRHWLGGSAAAQAAIVVITSVLFGAAHYIDQGAAGVQQATIVGLVFGTIYAFTGSLWLPMIAHIAFDLTALAIIYWNLESRVAHFFFN